MEASSLPVSDADRAFAQRTEMHLGLTDEQITQLALDARHAYAPGDRVRVNDDAPYYPGRTGTVESAERHGDIPGHWLTLDGSGMHGWVPAAALTPLETGGPR